MGWKVVRFTEAEKMTGPGRLLRHCYEILESAQKSDLLGAAIFAKSAPEHGVDYFFTPIAAYLLPTLSDWKAMDCEPPSAQNLSFIAGDRKAIKTEGLAEWN